MRCVICDRESEGKFCEFHQIAYKNLVDRYEVWKEAKGISWREYLSEIVENEFTGAWCKEVALRLLEEEQNE